MATQYLKGDVRPKLRNFTERYSPQDGISREYFWRGFDPAQVKRHANDYAAAGCEYEYNEQDGIATLRALDTRGLSVDGTVDVVIDTWEIGVTEQLVSSLRNPRNIDDVSTADLRIIQYITQRGLSMQDAINAIDDELGVSVSWSNGAKAKRLLERINAGSDSFYYAQYTLRHTTNVSNRYAANISDVNKGAIYSTAQLLSEAEDPGLWTFPLPGRLAYKVQNCASDVLSEGSVPTGYMIGWLKGASPESSAANNRVNIVTEYRLFRWSTDEYDTAS